MVTFRKCNRLSHFIKTYNADTFVVSSNWFYYIIQFNRLLPWQYSPIVDIFERLGVKLWYFCICTTPFRQRVVGIHRTYICYKHLGKFISHVDKVDLCDVFRTEYGKIHNHFQHQSTKILNGMLVLKCTFNVTNIYQQRKQLNVSIVCQMKMVNEYVCYLLQEVAKRLNKIPLFSWSVLIVQNVHPFLLRLSIYNYCIASCMLEIMDAFSKRQQ